MDMGIFFRLLISYLVCTALLILSISVHAQTCTETLDEAKALYADGNFYPIQDLISDCLKGGFTDEQKVEALEILTIVHNYNAELDSAEVSYLELLHTDPIYLPDSNKQVEIEYISKRFKTDPVWTIHGPRIGANWTFARIINNNGTDNTNQSNEKYNANLGGQISGGVELTLYKDWSIMAEGVFYVRDFNYTNVFYEGFDNIVIDDQQIGVEVPIYLKYQRGFKSKKVKNEIDKWYPYVYAGYSLNFLLRDRSVISYTSANSGTQDPGTGGNILSSREDINLSNVRNTFNSAIVVGTGVKYRLRTNYISLDVRYSFGLKNVVNPDKQFDFSRETDIPRTTENAPTRAYTFAYSMVDDDFRLDNLFISVGYIHPIYKPRSIDRKSVGDWIKGLFRKKDKDADFY